MLKHGFPLGGLSSHLCHPLVASTVNPAPFQRDRRVRLRFLGIVHPGDTWLLVSWLADGKTHAAKTNAAKANAANTNAAKTHNAKTHNAKAHNAKTNAAKKHATKTHHTLQTQHCVKQQQLQTSVICSL